MWSGGMIASDKYAAQVSFFGGISDPGKSLFTTETAQSID